MQFTRREAFCVSVERRHMIDGCITKYKQYFPMLYGLLTFCGSYDDAPERPKRPNKRLLKTYTSTTKHLEPSCFPIPYIPNPLLRWRASTAEASVTLPFATVVGAKVGVMRLIVTPPALVSVIEQDCIIINCSNRHIHQIRQCSIDLIGHQHNLFPILGFKQGQDLPLEPVHSARQRSHNLLQYRQGTGSGAPAWSRRCTPQVDTQGCWTLDYRLARSSGTALHAFHTSRRQMCSGQAKHRRQCRQSLSYQGVDQ